MTRICMTLSLPSALGLFLLATVAGCATLPSNSVNTNVPSDRLSSETSYDRLLCMEGMRETAYSDGRP